MVGWVNTVDPPTEVQETRSGWPSNEFENKDKEGGKRAIIFPTLTRPGEGV